MAGAIIKKSGCAAVCLKHECFQLFSELCAADFLVSQTGR